MAVCWSLDGYSVDTTHGVSVVHLKCGAPEGLDWFVRILRDSFPGCGIEMVSPPRRGGLLNLVSMADIKGRFAPSELGRLRDLLGLLEECLTMEDSLDESHALGYHQEEDDLTSGLRRTGLGELVYRAKYGSDTQARSQLVDLFGRFVSRHPRYGSAAAVAAVPPHSASGSRLSRHLAQGLAAACGMRLVPIRRARETVQQKAITHEDRLAAVKQRVRNQKDSMAVEVALGGVSVVVVDELYGSGASMEEATRSLRQAGASCVLGLAASKQRLFGAVSLRRRGW